MGDEPTTEWDHVNKTDAWRVVEKMRADGWSYDVQALASSPTTMFTFARKINGKGEISDVSHESPPTAICLAARAAKETERGG